MKTINDIGRIIFALIFGIFGVFHFINANAMSGMVPEFLPYRVVWVYFTGIALVAACIGIIIRRYSRIACLLLALMLLGFIFLIHLPVIQSNNMAAANLLKDMGLMGACLSYAFYLKN